MKKYLIIIIPLLMLSTVALVAACPSNSNENDIVEKKKQPAHIQFETELHDFGTFSRTDSAQVTFHFVYTNTGEKPLVIQEARPSCGCTKVAFSTEPVMPGQKGKVTVTYNGDEVGPGYFKKSVTITSNGSENPVDIFISGTMTE